MFDIWQGSEYDSGRSTYQTQKSVLIKFEYSKIWFNTPNKFDLIPLALL